MASSAVADNFSGRDDMRQKKQLQEARAAGTAAPETDHATGKIINPHNPQFITQAPWYLNQDKPSLQHHQAWNLKAKGTKDWYKRGTKGDVKTKFIKGACENCGATTHTKKDCVERPRKVTARQNGKNLMPDEFVEDLALDYEGKRDRWNGYQPDDYKEVIEEWEKIEEDRRRKKQAEQEERAKLKEKFKAQKKALKKARKKRRRQLRRQAEGRDTDGTDTDGTEGDSDMGDSDTDTDTDSDSDASDDEDLGEKMKDFDKTTNTIASKDDKLRTTTRNLRIREDTAKYLLNLDVNSAFYDPKSRSMRQNPLGHLKEDEQGAFRGDNFMKNTGESKQLTEITCFAWDAYKTGGVNVHEFAQPTQALKMFNVYKERSTDLKEQQQKELVEKYGGSEHMEVPREAIFAQNENYVEYSRDGRVLKGRERALTQSKYQEDVLIGNHSSVWGSFFDVATGKFGYKCCRQCMKNSYCVPQKKQESLAASSADAAGSTDAADATGEADDGGVVLMEDGGKISDSASSSSSSGGGSGADAGGEDAQNEKAERRKAAMEEKRKARALKGLKLFGKEDSAAAAAAAAAETEPAAAAVASESAASSSKLSEKRSSAFGHVLEEVTDLDKDKVAEAVKREKKRKREEAKQVRNLEDERNRKYNSVAGDNIDELSPEEYEAYRLTRTRADDPMSQFS